MISSQSFPSNIPEPESAGVAGRSAALLSRAQRGLLERSQVPARSRRSGPSGIIVLALLSTFALSSCTHVSLGGKGGKGGTSTGGGLQIEHPTPPPNQAPPPSTPDSMVSGDWRFGFQFENKTLQASVHIDQSGPNFEGTGTDDQTHMKFNIEGGQLNGNQVQFFKKYTSGKSAPIEYTGTIEMIKDDRYQGPYMHGEYTTGTNGKVISDLWEAEIASQAPAPPAAPPPTPGSSAPPPVQQPNHAPDLSGKWRVGYVYNFDQTIHSTMFLEQHGDRIVGHGTDDETKQKFVIEKGWYHFPRLTIIRKFLKTKFKPSKKQKSPPMVEDKTMAFKANVSWISDNDYQGPYLNGKTQGGGNWEAQQVK